VREWDAPTEAEGRVAAAVAEGSEVVVARENREGEGRMQTRETRWGRR
jgi:hypothetical protein